MLTTLVTQIEPFLENIRPTLEPLLEKMGAPIIDVLIQIGPVISIALVVGLIGFLVVRAIWRFLKFTWKILKVFLIFSGLSFVASLVMNLLGALGIA